MLAARGFQLPLALLLTLGGSLAACNRGSDTASEANAEDGTLLSPYLAIGAALAKDDATTLGTLLPALLAATKSHDGEAGVAGIAQGAAAMAGGDLATARAGFKQVSAGMIEAMKADPQAQAKHMLVHCPMTFEGKGALWVQAKGSVNNPYEGSRMLRCGDVVGWSDPLPE